MTKKRIYFDATPIIEKHISGIGKVLQETLRAMDTLYYAKKYDMYIFVPFDEVKKARKLEYTYIKLKVLPYPHKFFSLFTRLRWSPPIDLFLGRGVYIFQNYRNCTLFFSRSITYIHDVAFKIYPEFIQELNLKYLNKYINIWIRRADTIVAISNSSKRDIAEVMGITDVKVVVNAVNKKEYYPRTPDEIEAVRNKWNIPENYFIFIGNIEPRKNLVNTVKAFTEYAKTSGRNDSLVIIGGGGWRNDDILQAIKDASAQGVAIIRPNGYVPDEDLPALITGAKALLQFSWHEGFGLPVLQSLACGTPVAATDIPSLREVSKGNNQNISFAKDPANIATLKQAIERASTMKHVLVPENITTWEETIKSLESIIDSK